MNTEFSKLKNELKIRYSLFRYSGSHSMHSDYSELVDTSSHNGRYSLNFRISYHMFYKVNIPNDGFF